MAEFKTIDEAAFVRTKRKPGTPHAISARFDRRTGRMRIRLNTGLDLAFDPRQEPELRDASLDELAGATLQGAGGGLHFPALDADYSIARLLETFLGPMEWTRREARAAASRENGKLGGRPPKAASAR